MTKDCNQEPDLTVVLPVYNAAKYLKDALHSIFSQSFSRFECIAIDDGSNDSSGEILQAVAAADGRLRVVQRENRGLVATLNEGLHLARSNIIARMDADDICLPGRFAAQFGEMERRSSLAVLGGFIRIIDSEAKFVRAGTYPVGESAVARFLERGCPIAHPSVFMRRDAVLSVGGYRSAFSHAEDYDLWLRLFDAGFSIDNLPRTVLAYRQHPGSVSVRHKDAQAMATIVARLAHKVRASGGTDPTVGIGVIDAETIGLFPGDCSSDVAMEFFCVAHGGISLADSDTLLRALQAFRAFPLHERRSVRAAQFLLRAAYGAMGHGLHGAGGRALLEATRASPSMVFRMAFEKAAGSVRARRGNNAPSATP